MIAYANETDEHNSAVREGIEHAEQAVLGSENHAQLEKVEPRIDAVIPFILGGISIVILLVALYLKYKKKD